MGNNCRWKAEKSLDPFSWREITSYIQVWHTIFGRLVFQIQSKTRLCWGPEGPLALRRKGSRLKTLVDSVLPTNGHGFRSLSEPTCRKLLHCVSMVYPTALNYCTFDSLQGPLLGGKNDGLVGKEELDPSGKVNHPLTSIKSGNCSSPECSTAIRLHCSC